MSRLNQRINPVYSLKTQVILGAVVLLGISLGGISYFLIDYSKRVLTEEMERTVVFQGRNIALSSVKPLLAADPEFKLVPLVTGITDRSDNIMSVVITDMQGIAQGHSELQKVSQHFRPNLERYRMQEADILLPGEILYKSPSDYLLSAEVHSAGKQIGHIHLVYSKRNLIALIRRSIAITAVTSGGAFALTAFLALFLFRRISRHMDQLMSGVSTLELGRLDTRIELATKNEFRVLADSFNDMAARLADGQQDMIKKERMDRELELAREIQATLMPEKLAQPRGVEIATYYNSAMEVGGDYLDVIPVGDTRTAIVMADVSGKGVPGLVIMAMLKVMVHELVTKPIPPDEIIRRLNVSISKNTQKNMFVTLFYAMLDATSGELDCANAGHNPLIRYDSRRGIWECLTMKAPPLGVLPNNRFVDMIPRRKITLRPNDMVVQYTDGLIESVDAGRRRFGIERLIGLCEDSGPAGVDALVRYLVEAETRFRDNGPQADDIAILALRATQGSGVRTVHSFT
ncbi:MAG: SpoIIE family protein phosphatase [Candidatus Krumholzibacteria bacterium]|nr:SpoIIE family protein phosphatase [Candidatus Krumholzibacteria bacterium]